MIETMRLAEFEQPLQGRLCGGDAVFSEVSTDTRRLRPDDLYVALVGERFDGNAFAADAVDRGACGVIVSRQVHVDRPTLLVPDTDQALAALARANRERSGASIVAVTGSQGKTTVKELLGRMFRRAGPALVTRGNLNNRIGVPLTLLSLEAAHERAVIELGASGAGEIAYTVDLVQPHAAIITNAAETHLEGFGSLAGVVQAKGEIIDGVAADGLIVLNADDPAWRQWRSRAGARRVVSFSLDPEMSGTYRARDLHYQDDQQRFTLLRPDDSEAELALPLAGRHNVANALAAIAVALEQDLSVADVRAALASMQPVAGRLSASAARNGARLIDDSYNASPASYRAAIDVLQETAAAGQSTVLIAGEMAELGDTAASQHRRVGEYAARSGVGRLLALGPLGREMVAGFGEGGSHFADMESLINHAAGMLDRDVVVLVKGSRSAGMQRAVERLRNGEND